MINVKEGTRDKIGDSQSDKGKKLYWINCAKALAMIAVLMDHTMGILYTDSRIQEATIWHVSMFILISGITSYMSNSRSQAGWIKSYLKSVKKILEAYMICSAICLIIKTQGFDIRTYINQLIHFSASIPLYFVALYLQLMFVSRPLYYILQKCLRNKKGYVQEVILLCIIICIASFTTNHTQILDIYHAGGKVLGGTFFILFYLGMLMEKHEWFVKESKIKSIFSWLISSIGWLFWWKNIFFIREVVDGKIVWLGSGYEIPNIAVMGFTFLTLFAIYGACKILEMTDFTRKVVKIISWMGEHTLYIFMLHATILYFWLMPCLVIENVWLKRIVYMMLMIIVPLIIEYVVKVGTNKIIIFGKWIKMKQKKQSKK